VQATLAMLISNAMAEPNDKDKTAKAHSKFLETTLVIPTLRSTEQANFNDVICQTIDGKRFIPVFSEPRFMKRWAKELSPEFSFIHMKAANLLPLLSANDYLSLDLGALHYKEFSPDEVQYLMKICEEVLVEKEKG
jgi:hypothetical protein